MEEEEKEKRVTSELNVFHGSLGQVGPGCSLALSPNPREDMGQCCFSASFSPDATADFCNSRLLLLSLRLL